MYAKIQKDTTNIYILIESDEIELSNQTVPMPYSDYVRNFLPCFGMYRGKVLCKRCIRRLLLCWGKNYKNY